MIHYSDESYKSAKLIKQGKREMLFQFDQLAQWIVTKFNVKILNIFYEYDKPMNRPTLDIIFEYEKDAIKFHKKNDLRGNFDLKKQKLIAEKFKEISKQASIHVAFPANEVKLEGCFQKTEDLWVIFSAFDHIAKEEANESIPKSQILELKNKLGYKDLWEIANCFQAAKFFFYTDKQVKRYQADGTKKKCENEYFALLKQYDRFNYFKREQFSIDLDSKENFDKNYEGSWFYYWR